MKFKQAKNEIVGLGFEDVTIVAEYQDVILNAINRSMQTLSEKFPIKDIFTYENNVEQDGFARIDLQEVTKDGEDIVFSELIDTPRIITDDGMFLFTDYDIEIDRYLIIKKNITGTINFYFSRRIKEVDASTQEDEFLTVHHKAAKLLPILASYYVWLDDEPEKASSYYEDYQNKVGEIYDRMNTPKATIRSDLL